MWLSQVWPVIFFWACLERGESNQKRAPGVGLRQYFPVCHVLLLPQPCAFQQRHFLVQFFSLQTHSWLASGADITQPCVVELTVTLDCDCHSQSFLWTSWPLTQDPICIPIPLPAFPGSFLLHFISSLGPRPFSAHSTWKLSQSNRRSRWFFGQCLQGLLAGWSYVWKLVWISVG